MGLISLTGLWQDIQFALRAMRKSPRITLTVLATLALGIGANTAIFSIVNAVLLEPLPFRNPGQLVELRADLRGVGAKDVGFSVPEFEDLRDRAGIFDSISVVWQCPVNLTGGDHPERLEFLAISPSYFTMLGAHAQLGRLIDARVPQRDSPNPRVISDDLWHRSLEESPRCSARSGCDWITTSTPSSACFLPEFRHPTSAGVHPVDMWMTAGFRALPFPKPQRSIRLLPGIIGRLKPGITPEQAQAQLAIFSDTLRQQFGSDYPATAAWSLTATPLKNLSPAMRGRCSFRCSRSRPHPAHRLCQRRQPAVGQCRHPAAGDRAAPRARSNPWTDSAPAADRVGAAQPDSALVGAGAAVLGMRP